jgi:hypothetical protein
MLLCSSLVFESSPPGWLLSRLFLRTRGYRYVASFKIKLPQPFPSVPEDLEEIVDNTLSYQLCYEHVQPRVQHIKLCQMHFDRLRVTLQENQLSNVALSTDSAPVYWHIQTMKPLQGSTAFNALQITLNHDPKRIWVFATDGINGIRQGLAEIPF